MPENKDRNRRIIIISVVVVILFFAAGVLYFLYFLSPQLGVDAGGIISHESPVLPDLNELSESEGGLDKVPTNPQHSFPKYTGDPVRDLNPEAAFAALVGALYVEKYQQKLADVADRLDKDPGNYDGWLGVAYFKKLFNNYIGARDAWEYAKIVNPLNSIAYFNLGELYGYELKEPMKAEENYKAALRLDPYNLGYYTGSANFYKDVLKDPRMAEETWLAAIGKIPQTEVNLFTGVGAFYRDQGNYEKALEYYEKALGVAGNQEIRKVVQDEIDRIRSKRALP